MFVKTIKIKKKNDCQPMKYTSQNVTTATSKNVKTIENSNLKASSSNRCTSFDMRSITCPVENFSKALFVRTSV